MLTSKVKKFRLRYMHSCIGQISSFIYANIVACSCVRVFVCSSCYTVNIVPNLGLSSLSKIFFKKTQKFSIVDISRDGEIDSLLPLLSMRPTLFCKSLYFYSQYSSLSLSLSHCEQSRSREVFIYACVSVYHDGVTVGKPVARLPPYRSLHEVFPHKAPRLYSLPGRFASTGHPVQTFYFCDSRLGNRDERQKTLERLPGIASPLTAAIQPFEQYLDDLIITFPQ